MKTVILNSTAAPYLPILSWRMKSIVLHRRRKAALLEAMQERSVTVSGDRHLLPSPFFVLATQNPIEQEGTYPLPEAQLDRFMFNIPLDYPSYEEEIRVVKTTTMLQEYI
jgi:MoxR-like ATPase